MKKQQRDKKKMLELKLQRIRDLTPPELGAVVGGRTEDACDTSCRWSQWQSEFCPTHQC